MCGIAGIGGTADGFDLAAMSNRMIASLRHSQGGRMFQQKRKAGGHAFTSSIVFLGRMRKTMAGINAEVRFMMSIGNVERLRQFPRAGAKPAFIINAAPFFHQADSAKRLRRAN